MRPSPTRSLAAVLLATALTVSACGTDVDVDDDSAASPTPTATTSPSPTEDSSPADTASPTATGSPTEPVELPGRAVNTRVKEGEVLMVIGVAYDAVEELRQAPDPSSSSVTGIAPLSDVVATGASRRVPGTGVWHEVESGGSTGWVPAAALAWRGETTDETSAMVRSLGRRPKGTDMLDLGRKIAKASSFNDPTAGSKVTVSAPPTDGDPGQITLDVTGVPDDSVVAVRLQVFGSPNDEGGYTTKSVELTYLCGRGVDRRGFCV